MGVWTGMLKAGTKVFETKNEAENEEYINVEDLQDSEIQEIIMIHPELLKVFLSVGNRAQQVRTGIADTNDASPKKKESDKFKRSLDVMTGILQSGKQINPKEETKVKKSTERVND